MKCNLWFFKILSIFSLAESQVSSQEIYASGWLDFGRFLPLSISATSCRAAACCINFLSIISQPPSNEARIIFNYFGSSSCGNAYLQFNCRLFCYWINMQNLSARWYNQRSPPTACSQMQLHNSQLCAKRCNTQYLHKWFLAEIQKTRLAP